MGARWIVVSVAAPLLLAACSGASEPKVEPAAETRGAEAIRLMNALSSEDPEIRADALGTVLHRRDRRFVAVLLELYGG